MMSNTIEQVQIQLTRNLQRNLEEAYFSGELKLSNRKLKDFPKHNKNSSKINLQDTVFADLSKNRLVELPDEVTELIFLEKLNLHQNAIKCIPETFVSLQSLSYLDISRNQLTSLAREICRLPLQTLLVSYNKLVSLPEELCRISSLAELDVSYNELSALPSRMSELSKLKYLDIRNNFIVNLPIELMYLKLVYLDVSGNRISVLPNELRKMKSLVQLKVSDNPLSSPPAVLSFRGRIHIFKYLEKQSEKYGRVRQINHRFNPPEGYSNGEQYCQNSESNDIENVWSNETNDQAFLISKDKEDNMDKRKLERSTSENGGKSRKSLQAFEAPITPPSFLDKSPILEISHQKRQILHDQFTHPTNSLTFINQNESKSLEHIQTYREYKEALKLQRATDGYTVYRSKDLVPVSTSVMCTLPLADEKDSIKNIGKTTSSTELSIPRDSNQYEAVKYNNVKNKQNSNKKIIDSNKSSGHNIWNDFADKSSFTMKREFERAKEEAVLTEQLRLHIETRLKVSLPDNLAPALMDGVILCHLANHVRPRAIASIHVPSPAVPKLSMARCRRNVDNFIEACRKIGVDEEILMDAEAIMDVSYMDTCGLIALSHIVSTLIVNAEETLEESQSNLIRNSDERILSAVLLLSFFLTLIFLYIFPIPA